jgi:hypothetical protein
VDPDARHVTPHQLVSLEESGSGFTIIGAGKTAMDTCCWLIDQGVDPGTMRWIRPRNPLISDRTWFQPLKLIGQVAEWLALQMEAAAEATSVDDFLRRLEENRSLERLDQTLPAEVYKGPTLSAAELAALRSIENVVRLGRVQHIGTREVTLDGGTIATGPTEIHVDCSAPGLGLPPARTIFEPDRITIQRVQFGIDPFSAALIGYVEAMRDDDTERNRLCPPNASSGTAADFAPAYLRSQKARMAWLGEDDLRVFLAQSRLTPLRDAGVHLTDPIAQQAVGRFLSNTAPAIANLERILGPGV